MIGLKRGLVMLNDHCTSWAVEAEKVMDCLRDIFGSYATDIQHIGSTSIIGIKAKPIIDIAVGVESFERLDDFLPAMGHYGIYKSGGQPFDNIVLFSRDDPETGFRVNNIQVVICDSDEWNSHILFRDYMNSHPDKAREYERIKLDAAEKFPGDVLAYSAYKNKFIQKCITEAKDRFEHDRC